MALAADRAGIQFRTLNASKGPAVRATRAQADRQLYKFAVRRALESQPNLQLFQQEAADLTLQGERVVGCVTQSGIEFRARSIVLTVGTFLGGRIHVGLQSHAGGRAGDPAGESSRRAIARAASARRPPEDGHAAAHRRPQRRLRRIARAAQRRSAPGVLLPRHPRPAPAPASLPHHRHQRAHPRHHSRRDLALAPVHGNDRGRRTALLPVGRGQGRALCRPDVASDFHRTGGARHARGLSEWNIDEPAVRCAVRVRAHHQGIRAGAHHPAGLRHRIRLLRSARSQVRLGEQIHPRAVFRRANQRHHRLRRGRRAGTARGRQRRAGLRPGAIRGARSAARPIWACWSTI